MVLLRAGGDSQVIRRASGFQGLGLRGLGVQP